MGSAVSGITDAIGLTDSGAAAAATSQAAGASTAMQQQALDYMKQQNLLPTELRDIGLQSQIDYLSGTSDITQDPFYQAMLGGQEEAALRARSATGGLRSGQSIVDVGNVQNQAMLNTMGLYGGIGGTQTYAPQIAQQMAGIGQTQAAGISGAAQAQQMAQQQGMSNLMNLGALGIMAFSDDRLKNNPVVIADTAHPDIKKYRWEWNDKAGKLGMNGDDQGYLASEIENVWPDCVYWHESGYRQIDIPQIEKRLGEL